MKRRLKSELSTYKKDNNNGSEFEESILKIAMLAKGKVKNADFTSVDRYNILDLFVNNEKTLIKIYEALFPFKKHKQPEQ